MNSFLKDLALTLKKARIWLYMSYQELIGRYRRTTLGPWWITMGTGIGVGAMGIIWGVFFNINLKEFFPYIAVGFVFWIFLSASVIEAPMTYISLAHMMRSVRLPVLLFIFTGIMKNIYNLMHNFLIILVVFFVFQVLLQWEMLLFIPVFLLLMISTFLVTVILAFLGARFRDVSHIIASFMTFMFLLTPVMWRPDILQGKRAALVFINPFAYYLAIIREPLLGRIPNPIYYYGVGAMIVILFLVSRSIYKRVAHRIVFWL